jgi:hypothetical protein
MAPTLKTIIQLTGIASGASPSSAHHLNVGGLAVVPDEVKLSNPEFTFVSADDTNVVVRNDGAGVGDCNVLVEHWHTVERAFGAAQTKILTPQPFNAAAGAGASAASFLGFFGDGSDGDVILAGDDAATERWYNNLDTAGFDVNILRLFVRGTLTIRAGSHVYLNGANGVAGTGGAQAISTITGVGGGGGSSPSQPGTAVTTAGYGGDGGDGGAGRVGGGTPGGSGGAVSNSGQESAPRTLIEVVSAKVTGRFTGPGYDYILGGGGGGGGTSNGVEPPGDRYGGGGGAGAPVIVVSARNIIIEAGGFIEANGGDGANGEDVNCGGGGGGGGGVVLLCYETLVNAGTIQAAGGAKGLSGGGDGTDGVDGDPGNVFQLQTI